MKCISYFFMAFASTLMVIVLSLSSCSSNSKETASQPMVMKERPNEVTNQSPSQPQTSRQTADATVTIHNFKFEPANLTITVGKTVRFINADEEPHTVTATNGAFDSKALDTNQFWNYTANKPGTYPYICSIHPFMKGTLTVTPKKI